MAALNWDDLRYFLSAARAGSLAGAARAVGIEHSTIGRRLAGLERSLGAAVVLRNPDGLRLTMLGQQLLPLAEQVERAMQAVHALASSEQARVRLAVPSGMSQLLAPGLPQLRARHAEIVLEIVSGSRLADLRRGEADLAIRVGPVEDPDLVVKKLGEVALALYAAKVYLRRRRMPIDATDLAGHDVIAFDPALSALPGARWLEARAHHATIVLRSREMTDMVAAVVGGLGLGVLPCFLADAEPELVRLTRQPPVTSKLSLAYRREAKLARHIRAVAGFVVASMQQQASRLLGRQ
ncbi:MAG TPA: LysR family transcriptional regulator [Kofleriaceae bacterium]|nr:LysR family transcriptional regulator [Kofleriaceae bacterium]